MLLEATTEIGSRVASAIQDAARVTGAGFDYLLKTALRESNFDPSAKASTSSATGLFQFIDQTWLSTVKDAGPELGYSRYADAVVKTSSGHYVVPDADMRREVMGLRDDPRANAVMAGAFTKRNAQKLTARIGRPPTDGELYIAHFLGPAGAGKLISAAQTTPQQKGADLFPQAARANRSIFYDRQGGARSVAQVYGVLVAKHDEAGSVRVPTIASAVPLPPARPSMAPVPLPPARPAMLASLETRAPSAGISKPVPLPQPRPNIVRSAETAPPLAQVAFPVASVAPVLAASEAAEKAVTAVTRPKGTSPIFHGLFSVDQRAPVSPVVSELWGAKAAAPVAAPTLTAAPVGAARAGAPLDLFQFLRPELRGSQGA